MTIEIAASTAYQINKQIIECRMNIEANFIQLAGLLKRVRDERLFVALDHKTFESYIADPDLAMSRSKVYKLIRAWEVYVEKLLIPESVLIDIGSKRLEIILPVVPSMALEEQRKKDWLAKARSLSKSDLVAEVRLSLGKPIISFLPSSGSTPELNPGLSDLLKSCVVCGSSQIDAHHFPVTRGAGCPTNWTIPLCRHDHQLYHQNPKEWIWENRRLWAKYLFGTIEILEGQIKNAI